MNHAHPSQEGGGRSRETRAAGHGIVWSANAAVGPGATGMASQPFRYSGQGFSLQRDKGRFVVPAMFRKTVRESSGGTTLCLAKHDRWTCLVAFGKSLADGFEDLLDREAETASKAGRDFDRELRSMQLNNFVEVPFDDSGRFVLPGFLGERVGIAEQIYFQGGGDRMMLFAPDELYKMGAGFEGFQDACRDAQADALKAKKP
jgi:MraZ protein